MGGTFMIHNPPEGQKTAAGNKKSLFLPDTGTKGSSSAVPPIFAQKLRALDSLITAGRPSPSQGPLPGEPSACAPRRLSAGDRLSLPDSKALFSRSPHFLPLLIPQNFLSGKSNPGLIWENVPQKFPAVSKRERNGENGGVDSSPGRQTENG